MGESRLTLDGFVLGSIPLSERDKIVTLFTRDEGILKMVAYGARKPKSKYGSALELFNINEVILTPPKHKDHDLYPLKEFYLKRSHHKLREDYDNLLHLYLLAEFILHFLARETDSAAYYNDLYGVLEDSESHPQGFFGLIYGFMLRSLDHLGFLPDITRCSACHKKLEGVANLSSKEGWIFCPTCNKGEAGIAISPEGIKNAFMIKEGSPEFIRRLSISPNQSREIQNLILFIAQSILGYAFKSTSFIQ